MTNERRKDKRVAADVPAAIAPGGGDPVRGTIANVSEHGMFLKAPINSRLHHPVQVSFILKPDHTVCQAMGKVAWQAPHGIGVVFDEINDAFRTFVDELASAAESVNPAPRRQLLERILGDADIELA